MSEWARAQAIDRFSAYTLFLGELIQAHGFKSCSVQALRQGNEGKIKPFSDEEKLEFIASSLFFKKF